MVRMHKRRSGLPTAAIDMPPNAGYRVTAYRDNRLIIGTEHYVLRGAREVCQFGNLLARLGVEQPDESVVCANRQKRPAMSKGHTGIDRRPVPCHRHEVRKPV